MLDKYIVSGYRFMTGDGLLFCLIFLHSFYYIFVLLKSMGSLTSAAIIFNTHVEIYS